MLTPYPYQEEGAEFLARRRRAYLADRMGLGKTAQAILAAKRVHKGGPITVVTTASSVENWKREWELWGGPGEPVVLSYGIFSRGTRRPPRSEILILDEAHYLKTPSARRTRNVLYHPEEHDWVWLLSATPMPNHPGEFYAPFKALWPDTVGGLGVRTSRQWQETFCTLRETPWGPKPVGVQNGVLLRQILEGRMLRRGIEDVGLQLPPLRVDMHFLPPKALPAEVRADLKAEEYISTVRRLLGEAKAPEAAKLIVEELTEKQYPAIVVMYYHRTTGEVLRDAFRAAKLGVVGFDGSTPKARRQEAVDAFQRGEAPIFLVQQRAGGEAITLTAASEIVLVEPDWTPDGNDQAIARIHRIGQDAPCRARVLAFRGTADEHIMRVCTRKRETQKEVYGG